MMPIFLKINDEVVRTVLSVHVPGKNRKNWRQKGGRSDEAPRPTKKFRILTPGKIIIDRTTTTTQSYKVSGSWSDDDNFNFWCAVVCCDTQ